MNREIKACNIKNYFTYYMNLYDLHNVLIDEDTLKKTHKIVCGRDSNIQYYIPLLEQNFKKRGNWTKINENK